MVDQCRCGHDDDDHDEDQITGDLKDCKYCVCAEFSWASIGDEDWEPDDEDDSEFFSSSGNGGRLLR